MFFSVFLFVAVFTSFGADPCVFAAFVSQIMRENPACFLKYVLRKHMVAVGRVLLVLFEQKLCKQLSILFVPVQCSLTMLPFVVAGLADSHELT